MLPGRSGFDVCEALRSHDPRLPILMLTARGAPRRTSCAASAAGADDYVTKPFSVAELWRASTRCSAAPARGRRRPPSRSPSARWRVDPQALGAAYADAAVG